MGLLALSIIPAAILFILVYRADHAEKEPPRLLARLFCFGMLAVLIVMLPETILSDVLEAYAPEGLFRTLIEYLIVVAGMEEASKYLFLFTVRRNPNFNFTFDGIVYAVCVGLGFATLENIFYVVGGGGFSLGVARGLLSVPMHCVCAVYMGYYFGLAHSDERHGLFGSARNRYALAYMVPVFIHGLYDFGAKSGNAIIVAMMLVLLVVVYVFAIRRVTRSSREDRPI